MAIDSFAGKAPLKGGPKSMEYGETKGGAVDSFASKAPISDSPVSNLPSRKPGNHIDSFAAQAPLSEKPQKGYSSADTPMSKRSIKQSQ